MTEKYISSSYEKYKWMDKHPIKAMEYLGIKLKWHQKVRLLLSHYKEKRIERKYNKLMKSIMRVKSD